MTMHACGSALLGTLLVTAGCSEEAVPEDSKQERAQSDQPEAPAAAETRAAPELTTAESASLLFGYETSDHQLWMHYGTEEELYTVKTKEGHVLAAAIDAEVLARDYPDLHALVGAEGELMDEKDDLIDY